MYVISYNLFNNNYIYNIICTSSINNSINNIIMILNEKKQQQQQKHKTLYSIFDIIFLLLYIYTHIKKLSCFYFNLIFLVLIIFLNIKII